MKNVKITDEILNAAIDKLKELGCESIADCTYLREEDLCPPLKVIQGRKLLQSWKQSSEYHECQYFYCSTVVSSRFRFITCAKHSLQRVYAVVRCPSDCLSVT